MTENRLSVIRALRESDLVVEAATQTALHEFAPSRLAAGKHLLILSVGGPAGVLGHWPRLAKNHGCRIPVAAVSVASVGPEKTRLKIFAVPGQERNQHRYTVEGDFARRSIEIAPSENPRTGKLSYLSAIAMLREFGASVRVGN